MELTPSQSRQDGLRAAALFAVVAAGVSFVVAGALSALSMTGLGVAATVSCATGAAALAAWLFRRPLAKSRAGGETWHGALLGGAVAVVAYVGFVVVFSVAYPLISGEAPLDVALLTLMFGASASVVLVPVGAFTGACYVHAPLGGL